MRYVLHKNAKNLTGNRYGKLEVVEYAGSDPKHKKAQWLCHCDCGNDVTVLANNLVKGKTRSCGCLRKKVAAKVISEHWDKFRRDFPVRIDPRTGYKKGIYPMIPFQDLPEEEKERIRAKHRKPPNPYLYLQKRWKQIWYVPPLLTHIPEHLQQTEPAVPIDHWWSSYEMFKKDMLEKGWKPGLYLRLEDRDLGWFYDNVVITGDQNYYRNKDKKHGNKK